MLPQKVLEEYISGYHSYVLEEPFELEEVSGNLCLLLGCSREALLHGGYERAVHPQDRPLYQDFLHSVAGKEQPETAQYRLFRQDGSILHVSDAMTPARGEDGRLRGHSVLTGITAVCRENQRLHTVNDVVPCGIIMYSCESYPAAPLSMNRCGNSCAVRRTVFSFCRAGKIFICSFRRRNAGTFRTCCGV